jgi:hypothetical protein
MNKEEFVKQFVVNFISQYMVHRGTNISKVQAEIVDMTVGIAQSVWDRLEVTKTEHRRTDNGME